MEGGRLERLLAPFEEVSINGVALYSFQAT